MSSDLVPEERRGEGPVIDDIVIWVGQIYKPARGIVCDPVAIGMMADVNFLFAGKITFTDDWSLISTIFGVDSAKVCIAYLPADGLFMRMDIQTSIDVFQNEFFILTKGMFQFKTKSPKLWFKLEMHGRVRVWDGKEYDVFVRGTRGAAKWEIMGSIKIELELDIFGITTFAVKELRVSFIYKKQKEKWVTSVEVGGVLSLAEVIFYVT